jgi:tetratricopeptide (TPR) repeat protein
LRTSPYRGWLLGLVLIAVTALAYQPAWNGKPIWDDDIHITIPALRSLHGLARIWTDPAAAPQYYPVLHTVFWIEYKLWGAWPLPYHLVNILLHAVTALLLLKILQRLEVSGAWLAAFIFALHPVHVESVAWISEVKNTLSGALCAGAALLYLNYDRNRRYDTYLAAFALFLIGVMAKTVIVTLPAVLLVVFWWKRGRLEWGRDFKPLIPFFVVGIAAGIVTIWAEQKFSAREGEVFDFSLIERVLIAGRLFWFYLGNLFWPANLTLIYAPWNIAATTSWQYLFPIAAAALFVGLWLVRRKSRAPRAAFLCFVLMLFPVLGFFNLSYFMSGLDPSHHVAIFRADHFQYLGDIAIIVLVSAGAVWLSARIQGWYRSAFYVAGVTILLLLASLTWAQSRTYRDAETCFGAVLSKNPNSATAHNNLGIAVLQRGSLDEAIAHFEKAVEVMPDYDRGHYNLGAALLRKGQSAKAILHLNHALKLNPNYTKAYYSLASVLSEKGETDQAIAYYERALRLDPNFSDAHGSLGNILLEKGQIDAAITHYRKAIEIDPGNATARYNLAIALRRQDRSDAAVLELQKVLQIDPDYPDAKRFLDQILSEKTRKQ